MPKNNHKDFSEEKERLEETKTYLENTIGTVVENRIKFKEDIKDAYIHLDFLDSSLSYSSIMLNSKLLDELEKNFEMLLYARKKPYFARMDIKQNGKAFQEKLYIGKVSLFDESMEIPLVIDWRTPIASVYYDGRLGKASYTAAHEEHTIELITKRQYTIEEGELVSFMDVDISTTDTFLQASLEGHAGEKLKDIVSTIQAEQNQIIRADIDKPLIVQGVAGSGKTTIALHRIAYLIYTYADKFSPEAFMIIAPNTLFLDYISSVLPELGANKVKQTTYIDLMHQLIGKKLKMTDSSIKLNELIRTDSDAMSTDEKHTLKTAAALKNGMIMKSMLDKYLAMLETRILPGHDYYLDDILLMRSTEIEALFFEAYEYQPLLKRVERIKKYLSNLTRTRAKEIIKQIEGDITSEIDQILEREPPSEARRLKIVSLMETRDFKMDKLSKISKTAVKKYMDQFLNNDLLGFYLEFQKNIHQYAVDDTFSEALTYIKTLAYKNEKKIYELEDLAALVYLKSKTYGLEDDLAVRMVVIDEAQDFSDFQFYVLRQVLNTERFTILGDLSQAIHMYRSIENWDYLNQHIFKTQTNYLTLEQSYRTTIEIMDEANYVLSQLKMPDIIKAKPVVRHGVKPILNFLETASEIICEIILQVKKWQSEKLTTMAIITKSTQEAEAVFKLIKKQEEAFHMALIDEKTLHFDHRILVIPAHLAKGLEFDAVIITTLHETYQVEALDIKLMYVAMTRAMHRIALIGLKDSIAYYQESIERREYVS
ncbi:RNA polymerase recycling motor HelD [Fusibacter sp. 3D3]|uniref:RNA polymerase recycling motor HelD n=1 Tax=Fusibacter sp. 3D3 TaxID=1048380 RepID=UPI0008536971|nr:RNA polymerase recycling motor HelD [Fusibacter sp. 3D3]GAU76524.1 ATP-dependent DNA helicase [Fusibacter sp. 3D3]